MTTNDVLEEDLEHAARPLVDEAGEGLDAATTGEATLPWFDVVATDRET